MKILLPLIFCPVFLFSQLNPSFVSKTNIQYSKLKPALEGMFSFELNGKIGYMDKNGKEIIPAIYSYDSTPANSNFVPYFYNGCVKVVKDRKKGLIDKTGKMIIPIEHENITSYTQYGNFIVIANTIAGKKKYGALTLQNKELVPVEYDEIRVDTGMMTVLKNGKWGLIDKTGKQLLPCEYNWLIYSPTDKVSIAEKGTQYGVIDLTGKWLFEKTKSVFTLMSCKNGMVMCKVNSKYGFLDLKGNEVIVTRYEGAYDFNSYGLAMVYKKKEGFSYINLYGYIDKKGNEVIPIKYEYLGYNFFNGLVYAKDPETNRYGYIDKSGKWILQPVYLTATDFDDYGGAWVKMTDDKYHYINKTGKDFGTLNDKGSSYQLFGKDGYAVLESADYLMAVIDKNGKIIKQLDDVESFYQNVNGIAGYKSKATSKYGFLDLNGNKIIDPEFTGFMAFEEGIAKVDKLTDGKTKSGYIDDKGNFIVPIVYETAGAFRNGWGLVKKDANYFFVDRNGTIKDPPRKYDELVEFKSGYALGKIKGTGTDPHTFYYINTQLKEEFSVTALQAFLFWESVAVITRDNKTYDFLNKKGEVFKSLTGIQSLKFSSDGMLCAKENNKWGFINDKGDMIIKAKYDSTESFKYGYGRVKLNGKWGIVDKTGTEIFEPKYEGIYPGENGIFIYFDKYWGILDKSGKILVPPTYFAVNSFENDKAIAKFNKTFTILKSPLLKN